jgi:peptide chain release factor 1
MDASLRSKIESICERHDELNEMLSAPEVVADKSRFLELSREHADLAPVAEGFARYVEAERMLNEAKELLADPDMRELAESDVKTYRAELDVLDNELQRSLLPKDPNDSKNSVLEIRAGAGGDEAGIFAGDLWRMYTRYAETKGWTVELMSVSEAPAGGFKEISGLVRGRDVFAKLKFERGVHRVQRVPETEAQGRIHTSTATVAVMPEAEDIDVQINRSDLRIDVMRASGSGGQSVNTTDSAVRITHIPTGLAVHCTQEKSQAKNRDIAMQLLRTRLLDLETRKYEDARAADRREQVGTGDRSEKIRTYNYPQDRVSDHRIGVTRHNLPAFMNGELDEIIDALRADDEATRLAELKKRT